MLDTISRPRATQETVVETIKLAQLVLDLGRVDRVTLHEDGRLPESDTTHTVMLGVLACALAAKFQLDPPLDLGLVAQFALVHDLAESLCGDTNTLGISPEERTAKTEREREAIETILVTHGLAFPWLKATMKAYERQDTPEAKFVRYLDKAMPKITYILNHGASLRRLGMGPDDLIREHAAQFALLDTQGGADLGEVRHLMRMLMDESHAAYRSAPPPAPPTIRVVVGVASSSALPATYLVARRAGGAYSGCWEFPGGKVEAGEGDREALAREWKEELGVDITVGRFISEHQLYTAQGVPFIALAYRVGWGHRGGPRPVVHSEFAWMTPDDIMALTDVVPSLFPIMRSLCEIEEG